MTKHSRRRYTIPLEELRVWSTRSLERSIARFDTACMSNTKWRKVLQTLANLDLAILGYRWKFVDDNRLFITDVVLESEIAISHVRDGVFQPFVYKEIEWLDIQTAQPDEIIAVLAVVGKFAMQPCDGGIRVFGYR